MIEELLEEISFELNSQEIEALDRPIYGNGADQDFGRKLAESIDRQTNRLILSDSDLGRIARHMTQDTGEFENRLRTAFARCFRELLAGPSQPWAD